MLRTFIPVMTLLIALVAWESTGWAAAPSPVQLTGSGKQVTRQTPLPPGVYVFRMHHSGRRNFIVQPISTDGQKFDVLVNAIGEFNGSAVFTADKERTYLFSVNADGPWAMSIESPKKAPEQDQRRIKGHGQQSTAAISLEGGLYVFEMKHTGKRNFIVHPFSLSGQPFSPLMNEIGAFDGSCAETFEKGDYLFQIAADGDWEIVIKKQ